MSNARPSGRLSPLLTKVDVTPAGVTLVIVLLPCIGDVEVACRVKCQAVGLIEPAVDEGRCHPRRRHLDDRVRASYWRRRGCLPCQMPGPVGLASPLLTKVDVTPAGVTLVIVLLP